jgi:AcrR family transcriptional regulator
LPSGRTVSIAAADELFYTDGVHAVTIDRVIEKASVARGSLYYNFEGKDDLIREYLLGRHAAWTARVDAAVGAAKDPAENILAVFDALGTLFAEPSYRGCSFMNATCRPLRRCGHCGPDGHIASLGRDCADTRLDGRGVVNLHKSAGAVGRVDARS